MSRDKNEIGKVTGYGGPLEPNKSISIGGYNQHGTYHHKVISREKTLEAIFYDSFEYAMSSEASFLKITYNQSEIYKDETHWYLPFTASWSDHILKVSGIIVSPDPFNEGRFSLKHVAFEINCSNPQKPELITN
ncbi:hypothetical protein K1X76_07535 [bacterium]|nr:hypothetical protein [bacterium]